MHRTPATFIAADLFTAAILGVGYVTFDLRTTLVFVSDFLEVSRRGWLGRAACRSRPSGVDKTPSDLSWPSFCQSSFRIGDGCWFHAS